jgi:hypothetical protein
VVVRFDIGIDGWVLGSAEVGVGFVDPVFARGAEDVEGQGVFEGDGGVGGVAGDYEDLVGFDDADVAVAEVEAEGAGDDVADLLVGVGVAGDDAAFGEEEAGEHGLGSVDELALQEGVELLEWNVGPAIESGCCHWERPFVFSCVNLLLCVERWLV